MKYSINVSFPVWQKIHALRESEHMTEDDVLRQLLKLPPDSESQPTPPKAPPPNRPITGGIRLKGVFLPNGTKLHAHHHGAEHIAEVVDGVILCNGKKFRSLSPAAAHSLGLKAANGWSFWMVQRPGEKKWEIATNLRAYNPSTGEQE